MATATPSPGKLGAAPSPLNGPGASAGRAGAVHRGLLGRLSAGHLLMIVAGLVGMVLTLALLRAADDRVEVAAAEHDLAPGTVLGESDVRFSSVSMDRALLATVLQRRDLSSMEGSVVTGRVAAGDLIARSGLRPAAAPSGKRAMSIPIDPARAVNGALTVGDRVDVVVATAREVAIVVADAEVLGVHGGDRGGAFGGVDQQFAVTLAVDARESQVLTAATVDGDLMITRATGASSAKGIPPLPIDRAVGTP